METTTKNWGRWELDMTYPACLNIRFTPGYRYRIYLDECNSKSRRDYWLEHMSEKRFVTGGDLVNLRKAFNDLVTCGLLPN